MSEQGLSVGSMRCARPATQWATAMDQSPAEPAELFSASPEAEPVNDTGLGTQTSETRESADRRAVFSQVPAVQELDRETPPAGWRELLGLFLIVALSDLTIYRGKGFAGYAALIGGASLLLPFGAARLKPNASVWVLAPMLWVLAARLLWCGSPLALAVGFAVLVGFVMALNGLRPYVLEAVVFTSRTIHAGYRGVTLYGRTLTGVAPFISRIPAHRARWLAVGLPLVTFVAFSVLFMLANPDLLHSFSLELSRAFEELRVWLIEFGPQPLEVLFWLVAGWVTIGLLRPVIDSRDAPDETRPAGVIRPQVPAALYAAFRNTLIVVIVLFAAYLAFEFNTLWFRVFEQGFHYSGYAHEGAAWLTVALALATAILSLIFRGAILNDLRIPRLRRLAWLWSLENILLAIAVYHRLFIYIGFNGMTRMRTVALYGVSAVLVGFLVVLWKIAHNRHFLWLLRRHLWTLAIFIYLYAVTPVDVLVMKYNVRRIMNGDPAPCVQISVHPISAEGVLLLPPLLECDDVIIREGIRAMLADRHESAEAAAKRLRQDGWTAFQLADDRLLSDLRDAASHWTDYTDREARKAALSEFHKYAYQWY